MHFLKKGQKIRAWVDPPPSFGHCPKKRFVTIDVFPYLKTKCNPKYKYKTKDKHKLRHVPYFGNNTDLRILNLKLRNRGLCKYKCVGRNQAKNLGKVSFLSAFKSFYPTKNTPLDSPTCFLSHLRSV